MGGGWGGGGVEDKFIPARGNICISTSICTIKYMYHDQ